MKSRWFLRGSVMLLLACGCASSRGTGGSGLSADSGGSGKWASPLYQEHPLAGRIYDVRLGKFVDEAALGRELIHTRYVLLGEQHDNADHHRLQASLVRAMTLKHRKPVLAFEMLDVTQQPDVDKTLARAPGDVDGLAAAVDWAHSGWPDWTLYRPVFAAGLEKGLPIVGVNLPREQVKEIVKQGAAALDAGKRKELGLDTPLPVSVASAMHQEMKDSHCGELPEEMLEPMVLAQRARDGQMAEQLLRSDKGDGAILITGAGHARTDRGVPARLSQRSPGRGVLSVGFIEVTPGANEPQAYAAPLGARELPFDYIWFTPAAQREDPCAGLRQHQTRAQR